MCNAVHTGPPSFCSLGSSHCVALFPGNKKYTPLMLLNALCLSIRQEVKITSFFHYIQLVISWFKWLELQFILTKKNQ